MKKKERMGFISLFIFLILSAFVLVCLESGLILHAEEGYNYNFIETYGLPSDVVYLNQNDYENSDIYIEGNTPRFDVISLTKYQNFYSDLANIHVSTELPNFGVYPNFFIYCTDNRYFKIIFFDDNELNLILCNNSMLGARLSNTNDFKMLVYDSNSRSFSVDTPSYAPWDSSTPAKYFSSSSRYNSYYCLSNYPILYTTSTSQNSDVGNQYYYDGSSGFNDVNYLDFENWGTDYSSIYDSTTLFDGSVMYITNTTFNDGTFYIYPVFNNTQKENADNFKLRLVGSCQYVCHKDDDLTKQPIKYNNVWLSTYFGIPESGKTFSCSLRSDNGNYWDIPFSSINGGVYSAKLSAINNSMYYPGGDYPIEGLASSLSSFYGSYFVPFSQALNSVASNITGGALPIASENGNVVITGCTYHFDLYVVSTVNGEEITSDSPVMNYDIDMINGTINGTSFDNLTNIDDLNDAYNNEVPQSSYPSSSPSTNYGGSFNNYDNTTTNPGGGSGGGGSSSSGGSVVNNNSDTLNITGNGEVAKDIVEDLIPTDGVGGFTEQIEQTLQANSWMQVVKSTFSFIPTAVFTQISLYIITVLGILAAAFVLRIVLDLL